MSKDISRDALALYIMNEYDGDVAALEAALADDDAARDILGEEAALELALRDAADAATFCPNCDDLITEPALDGVSPRCGSCGCATSPGGYTVERVLVANAHGRMYVARDADGTQVALKELAFVQAPGADTIAAFEREARFLRALSHPAIPRYRAAFEEGHGVHTRYYLAQDLVDGTALDTRLDEHFYTEAEIIDVARQVLQVLVYLQTLSPMVIHRDIKPANMLRRADGSIALVDFGAAHVQGTTAGSTSIGTFGYMPLEQLAGNVDATTDGYALGASLVHLLTRREPWRILALPTLGASNVSPALSAFLAKLVAPEPEHRFPSAAAALAALDNLGKEPETAVITGAAARRLRKQHRPAMRVVMAALAIPALLFVVGGVIFGGVQAVRYFLRDDTDSAQPASIPIARPPRDMTTAPGAPPGPADELVVTGHIVAAAPIVLAGEGDKVAALEVEVGDRVAKGQVVAVMAEGTLRAELALAQARLKDAKRSLARTRQQYAAQGATMTDVERAQGNVEIAEAESRIIAQKLDERIVRSPIAGTVLEIASRPGEAPTTLPDGTVKIMTLADLSSLVAKSDVAAPELDRIESGQRVSITTDAHPGRVYTGRVATKPSHVDANRGTALLEMHLDKVHDDSLKPGTAIRARFLRETPTQPTRYTSRVSVDIRIDPGADLTLLLRRLSQLCKFNIVIPAYVRATVGTALDEVPCDDALAMLLDPHALDYRFDPDANLMRIAAAQVLRREEIEAGDRAQRRARLSRPTLPSDGGTVDLDVFNAPMPDVLARLAAAGNVQVFIPEHIKDYTVSTRLAGVPWQRAMETVLTATGLDYRYQPSSRIVRIGSVKELDREDIEVLDTMRGTPAANQSDRTDQTNQK